MQCVGMGDSCCATWSIGALQKQIQEALPGMCSVINAANCMIHNEILVSRVYVNTKNCLQYVQCPSTLPPGTFVHSIATGTDIGHDTLGGYFGNVNDQVRHAT